MHLNSNTKTSHLLFSPQGGTASYHLQYNLEPTKQVAKLKYLGVFYDKKTCWDAHIEYVAQKASKPMGIDRKLAHC